MTQLELILLFPALFMLHEMEEILLFPQFRKRISEGKILIPERFKQVTEVLPFRFNLIVFQQFVLLLVLTALSYQFHWYMFYMAIMLGFSYHVIGHIAQTLYLKKYTPGVLSGIISSGLVIFLGKNWTINWKSTILLSLLVLVILVLNLLIMYRLTRKIDLKNTEKS